MDATCAAISANLEITPREDREEAKEEVLEVAVEVLMTSRHKIRALSVDLLAL